jgi:hypothetical protein
VIPVVEDYLSELLTKKIQFIRENPNELDNILGISKPKLDSLKEFFQGRTLNVRLGFPRTAVELPCVSIVLSSEDEMQDSLGDYSEDYIDGPSNNLTETVNAVDTIGGLINAPYIILSGVPVMEVSSIINMSTGLEITDQEYEIINQATGLIQLSDGSAEHGDTIQVVYSILESIKEQIEVLYETTYRLEVWAKNADLTVELYHLVKWALLSGRDELVNDGLFRQKLSGSDFQPAPNYFPEFVYRRALSFWCQFLASTPTDAPDVHFIQSIIPNQHLYDYNGGDNNV